MQVMRTFGTIDDIQAATEDGSFEENHYLEAKTILKARSNKDKDELARDLAQFAFDGGTVVFGVYEDKNKAEDRFSVVPIELTKNVREQIEQIAQERCQPPLPVQVRELGSGGDAETGCIVVEVPPSSRVPHMVAEKYPFRGDSTRRYLSDSEVRMWMARSDDVHERVDRELRELVTRDPYSDRSPRAGHLFGVAVPLTSRHDGLPEKGELHQLLREAAIDFGSHWRERFRGGDPRSRRQLGATALNLVGELHPRSREYALRSRSLSALESGEDSDPAEDQLAEWSVDMSGIVRVYDAGLSMWRKGPRGDDVHAIWSIAPVEMTGILVESARLTGDRIGYHGQWGFGVAWTGLRGASLRGVDLYRNVHVIDRGEGSTQYVTSALELRENPSDVLDRTVRPLLRMIGDEDLLTSL